MKNPWLAKNPFLSMWLSAANTVAGAARGHAIGQARRTQGAMMNEASKAMFRFWSGQGLAPTTAKRKRRSKLR